MSIVPNFSKIGRSFERILGPRLSLKEINLICWALFSGLIAIPFSIVIFIHWRTSNLGDFVYFYGIGRVVRDYGPENLYNHILQIRLFNEIEPAPPGMWGPSPYPPFVALVFSLIAKLTFRQAYLVWGATSLILYTVGIGATLKCAFPADRFQRSLLFCFTLAYGPFMMNTLANGQLASIAVCGVGLAFLFEKKSWYFASGICLAALTYKPTLLLAILPMLIVTKRIKTVAGFVLAMVAVTVVTTIFMGPGIWEAYVQFTVSFGKIVGLAERSPLLAWQCIDLRSQLLGLLGAHTQVAIVVFACFSLLIAVWLYSSMWKLGKVGSQDGDLVWAVTLIWTLLINVYVPIYDSDIAVIALILTFSSLKRMADLVSHRWLTVGVCCALPLSWETKDLAGKWGVQPLTVALLAFGLWQISLIQRSATNHDEAKMNSGLADGNKRVSATS